MNMKKIFNATQTLNAYNRHLPYTNIKEEAEYLVVGGKPIDLDEFPKLKGIFKTGVGKDNLPFDEAKKRGIIIKLPSENTKEIIYQETASFSVYLILNFLYKNQGDFKLWKKNNRRALSKNKVLVMGTGKIGFKVVKQLNKFVEVLTYDPIYNKPEELDDLLTEADVVTLHLPLTSKTENFFDKKRLAKLKDNTLIVNTSRGHIINEKDLYIELFNKRLNAALDVFWQEPYNGILMSIPEENLIVTPHIASTCKEFLEGLSTDFIKFYNEN